jgi:hypothetical protein
MITINQSEREAQDRAISLVRDELVSQPDCFISL